MRDSATYAPAFGTFSQSSQRIYFSHVLTLNLGDGAGICWNKGINSSTIAILIYKCYWIYAANVSSRMKEKDGSAFLIDYSCWLTVYHSVLFVPVLSDDYL